MWDRWYGYMSNKANKQWSDMKKIDRWKLQFPPRRIFIFIFDFIWVVILWVGIIGKIFNDSISSYIGYFTNWAWTYQGAFWLLYLFSYLEDPKQRTLEYWLLYAFWWNIFAQSIIVFVLVIAIFQDDATIIIGETKTGGGKYDDGTVLNYNMLFHYAPVIWNVINIFALWNDIADMLVYTFGDIIYSGDGVGKDGHVICRHTRFQYRVRKEPVWLYIAFSTFLAVVPILTFYNVFDIRVIYNLNDFPTWAGIIVTIFFAFASVFLPLQYMFRVTIPSRFVPDYQRGKDQKAFDSGSRYQLKRIPLPSD